MGESGGAGEGAGFIWVDEEGVGFFFGSFVAVVEFIPVALKLGWSVRAHWLAQRVLLPRSTFLLE